jgi:hypothetical protein
VELQAPLHAGRAQGPEQGPGLRRLHRRRLGGGARRHLHAHPAVAPGRLAARRRARQRRALQPRPARPGGPRSAARGRSSRAPTGGRGSRRCRRTCASPTATASGRRFVVGRLDGRRERPAVPLAQLPRRRALLGRHGVGRRRALGPAGSTGRGRAKIVFGERPAGALRGARRRRLGVAARRGVGVPDAAALRRRAHGARHPQQRRATCACSSTRCRAWTCAPRARASRAP